MSDDVIGIPQNALPDWGWPDRGLPKLGYARACVQIEDAETTTVTLNDTSGCDG